MKRPAKTVWLAAAKQMLLLTLSKFSSRSNEPSRGYRKNWTRFTRLSLHPFLILAQPLNLDPPHFAPLLPLIHNGEFSYSLAQLKRVLAITSPYHLTITFSFVQNAWFGPMCLDIESTGMPTSDNERWKQTENCNQTVDNVTNHATISIMIKSFKHKGLAELFERGSTRRLRQDLQSRCLRRLDALDQSESLRELNVPGFNFHSLRGIPKRYSIHVNGPWSITFEWERGEVLRVNLEQYH